MPKPFDLGDADPRTRLRRLPPDRTDALQAALSALGRAWDGAESAAFLLPLAEAGFTADLMRDFAERLPAGWPRDHREVYFDFRLGRWSRHLEPPTLAECLDEHVRTAGTPEEGLDYAKREWNAFLERQAGTGDLRGGDREPGGAG
jgi:hypothetical protein